MFNAPATIHTILAPLTGHVMSGIPLSDVRDDSDDLCGRATYHITMARAELVDMASSCLNRSSSEHVCDIEDVHTHLIRAMNQRTGARPRDRLQIIANDLAELAKVVDSCDLDDLGSAYCIAEMRLAVILLADIDGKGPNGGPVRQSLGDGG